MSTFITKSILQQASVLPEGGILSPKEFLHMGNRAAIDQTFTRLTKEKILLRVGRGLYTLPIEGRFGKRFPTSTNLLAALSEKTGEVIVVHGAMAANQIGLSLQVPVREIYLTSGRNRNLCLDKLIIELRHAPTWQLLLGNSLEGKLLRALTCLGAAHIKEMFPNLQDWRKWQAWPEVKWKMLFGVISELPSWLVKVINEAAYA